MESPAERLDQSTVAAILEMFVDSVSSSSASDSSQQLRDIARARSRMSLRAPHAIHGRIDVDEEAQNSVAAGGPVGSRVDMYDLVAGAGRQRATLFLQGPKAARAHRPSRDHVRNDSLQVPSHDPAVLLEDCSSAYPHGLGSIEARHRAGLRMIAHVLDSGLQGQLLAQEIEIFPGRQIEGTALEVDDLAVLQSVHDPGGRCVGVIRQVDGCSHLDVGGRFYEARAQATRIAVTAQALAHNPRVPPAAVIRVRPKVAGPDSCAEGCGSPR